MSPIVCLLLLRGQVPIDRLDALAHARDVAGLSQFLADSGGKNPFNILKTGGGYAAGSMGWHAKLLEPKDGTAKFVVFSTPILVEDAGELLFRLTPDGKLVFVPERDDLGYELDHHAFDVSFDLPAHRIMVTDQFRGKWTKARPPHFVFRFSPTFEVAAVTDMGGHAVPFVQSGGVVAVSPTGPDPVFNVRYAGTVDKPGFAHVIGPDEATLSGTMWYPMVARHPSTYDAVFHTPIGWLTLAQGDQISTQVAGNTLTSTYRMTLPVVWISTSSGPYRKVTSVINGHQFSTMSATATDEAMRTQNENNAEVVDFYSKTFGPYPFKSWTTLDSKQFQEGVGALEAYSFATYPAGGVPFQDSHEPAHTWWGGIINNDYLASIWNESFADYSQVIFLRDRPIGNLEERQRAFVPQMGYTPAFDAAPLAQSGQDIGPPATALGYAKGAYVLGVLEDELGTDAFLRTLREWIRTNPVGHIGSWEDYEAVVDRVAGRDLTWFFDEWVRRPGLPNFSLTDGTWDGARFNGKVTFKGAPYRLDTDAVLEFADGTRSYSRVTIDPATGGGFTIPCGKKPALAALDPWQKIARRNGAPSTAVTIRGFRRDQAFVDPANPGWMKRLVTGDSMAALPADLDGVFVVGSPATLPALAPLCAKAGFRVDGNRLTYKGTTVDLTTGGAVAVVDLPNGKRCMIGLGTCARRPDFGRARLALLNEKAEVVRAETDPDETGPLSIRI